MKTSIYSILIVLFVVVAGCQNDTEPPFDGESAVDEIRTIEIYGVDSMRFMIEEQGERLVTGEQSGDRYVLEQIIAEPGEQIRIILYNDSELPVQVMGHNLVILEQDVDTGQFVQESMTAVTTQYISPDYVDQVIVATGMLGGGESDTIEFTAPDESGEYDYVCSFPGHYAAGMDGVLVVQ